MLTALPHCEATCEPVLMKLTRPSQVTIQACLSTRSDLGVHIDGFIATEATTVVAQADADAAVSGRAADVVQAAAMALEAALRLIRPGRKISDVAEPLQKVPPCVPF